MGEGLLELCELSGGESKLERCHVCTAVDESYTIAQWLAHLPCRPKIPGLNPGDPA